MYGNHLVPSIFRVDKNKWLLRLQIVVRCPKAGFLCHDRALRYLSHLPCQCPQYRYFLPGKRKARVYRFHQWISCRCLLCSRIPCLIQHTARLLFHSLSTAIHSARFNCKEGSSLRPAFTKYPISKIKYSQLPAGARHCIRVKQFIQPLCIQHTFIQHDLPHRTP